MPREPHIPDLRTYAFHEKAAEILRAHPERIVEVHAVLNHWLGMPGTQAEGWAGKWQQLIDGLSTLEIADLICKQGEEMDFYRKSSPFACLLSEAERLEIIRRFQYNHE